jgi:hypothetical protein
MTEDEKLRALLTDELTGLGNRRAWEEGERMPVQAMVDVEGLKWANDNIGWALGDALLLTVANAIREQGVKGYRLETSSSSGARLGLPSRRWSTAYAARWLKPKSRRPWRTARDGGSGVPRSMPASACPWTKPTLLSTGTRRPASPPVSAPRAEAGLAD